LFVVIPAVDVRRGRCVRLFRGSADEEVIFAEDPVEAACKWESEGAKLLHVVDLDGAFTGQPENFGVIKRIIESVSIPVEVGGGIRESITAQRYLEAGADRIVVGTRALTDPKWLRSVVKKMGDSIVVGVDARKGKAATSGWTEYTAMSTAEAIRFLCENGVRRIIYTDISRDGTMSGPNFSQIERVAKISTVPVIVSGGIGSLEDVIRISRLEPVGVEGVIVGMALYKGAIDLREAIRVTEKRDR